MIRQRLTDALTEGAQGAPSAAGLAAAARSRARARRRNRLVGAAAVVALAVAVPTAVWATHGSDPDRRNPSRVANDPDAVGQDIRGGYHYESWHDVTIEVPNTGSTARSTSGASTTASPTSRGWIGPEGRRRWSVLPSLGLRRAVPDHRQHRRLPVAPGPTVGRHLAGGRLCRRPRPGRCAGRGGAAGPGPGPADPGLGTAQRPAGSPRLPGGCRLGSRRPRRHDDGVPVRRGWSARAERAAQRRRPRGRRARPGGGAVAAPPGCAPDPTPARASGMASVAEDAGAGPPQLRIPHGARRVADADLRRPLLALSPGWSGTVPGDVSLPSELR